MHLIFCTNMRSKLVTFCTLLFSTNNTIQNTLCKYRIHEEKFYIFVCFCCRFIFVEIFKLWKLNIPLASASTIFSATLCVIHILDKIINHRSSRLSCIFVHAQIENPKFVSQIIIKRVFFHPYLFSSLLLASPLYNVIFRNFLFVISMIYTARKLCICNSNGMKIHSAYLIEDFWERFTTEWSWIVELTVSKFKYSIQFEFFCEWHCLFVHCASWHLFVWKPYKKSI